ncbi:putative phosphotransferase family protein [Phaeomoniella chlamydospora]|uniref:Putative phosphotransferase family protein n=1 Tax=Phaeomoniella chlamydospora TaxID=158046 RepID=A0A0G2F040_PHACM|nr:putative phosphotransferase family protein [Phaeomoniella chlamydospora]
MATVYEKAVQGEELSNDVGNRVIASRTSGGCLVAVKVKDRRIFRRSEADMMNYASHHTAGILAPHVLGCYDVEPQLTTMVSDLVPGLPLDTVRHNMNPEQQNSIKLQLKDQLRRFRECAQTFIGRVNRQSIKNFFERTRFASMGPWDSEKEFDDWCLSRVKSPLAQLRWKHRLSKLRRKESSEFVLTHGDLAAHNIMVKDGQITEIIDCEYNGFFPKYMKYVCAMVIFELNESW